VLATHTVARLLSVPLLLASGVGSVATVNLKIGLLAAL
jgi:hypothetical protein